MEQMEFVTLEIREKIAFITLNRPEKMNALSESLKWALWKSLDICETDRNVRAVILTGNGRAFCAGADLGEVAAAKAADPVVGTGKIRERTQKLILKIYHFPKPVIAAINGAALGGGAELAMACDFRIASEKAIFGLPEAKMALMPGFGGTQLLPRIVPVSVAKELLMSGRSIDAEEGKHIGLYQAVVQPEALLDEAASWIGSIINNGPMAVRCIKEAVNQGLALPIEKAFELELELCAGPSLSEDAIEGAKAFREKRLAIYKDK